MTLYELINICGITVLQYTAEWYSIFHYLVTLKGILWLCSPYVTQINYKFLIVTIWCRVQWFTFMSSYTQQSSITDSGEERAAAATRDNKDKVGVSNDPVLTACISVCIFVCFAVKFQKVLLTAIRTRLEIRECFKSKSVKTVAHLGIVCSAFHHELKICFQTQLWNMPVMSTCVFLVI